MIIVMGMIIVKMIIAVCDYLVNDYRISQ